MTRRQSAGTALFLFVIGIMVLEGSGASLFEAFIILALMLFAFAVMTSEEE